MLGPEETPDTQRSDAAAPRLRIGTRLTEDAFSADDILLLRAGARIQTRRELERLSEPGVRFGPNRSADIPFDTGGEAELVCPLQSSDPGARDLLQKVTRAAAIKTEAVHDARSVMERVGLGEEVDLESAKSVVSSLLSSMLDDPRALVSLAALKDVDAYTFTHSVNVGIMAMHLAMHTHYRNEVEEIGLGALLHDVGKMRIPPDVLNKPDMLQEEEWALMRAHPIYGCEQLRNAGETREPVLSCVLGHHEKINGTGYPSQVRGLRIAPHARITAIADVYDALTTQRSYKPPMTSKDALLLMARGMTGELDHRLLECFISIIGFYPVGSDVELSDGSVGTVLKHYASNPNRPSVILHTRADGGRIEGGPVLDLTENRGLTIVRFVRDRKIEDIARAATDVDAKAA